MEQLDEVLTAIEVEREYQDARWGDVDVNPHEIGDWLAIMRRELKEAQMHHDAYYQESVLPAVLKTIAVGVACLQQHGVVLPNRD